MEVLAHYLPQFHPIPENDEWWETGFTEWTNVTRATRLFSGPCPAPSALRTRLLPTCGCPKPARRRPTWPASHGLTGFCYWHYWFGGRRILERPLEEVLALGRPGLSVLRRPGPISRGRGSGTALPTGSSIEQTYPGPDDDRRPLRLVCGAHSRTIATSGSAARPLLFIYQARRPAGARRIRRAMAGDGQGGGIRRPVPRRQHGGVRVPDARRATASTPAVWYRFPFGRRPRRHRSGSACSARG